MTAPDRRLPAAQQARHDVYSAVDRAVITAGILMAVASASFATYMVASDRSRPQFTGVEHLMIFAQPNRGLSQPLIARVPAAPDDQGIDYTATGAIPGESKSLAPPNYTLPAINGREEQTVKEFTLRGVSGKDALVDGPGGLYRLEAGSVLPGGGRVLAIEWRQGTFVVVTTRGLIRGVRP
jgi:hypothetical protein